MKSSTIFQARICKQEEEKKHISVFCYQNKLISPKESIKKGKLAQKKRNTNERNSPSSTQTKLNKVLCKLIFLQASSKSTFSLSL